MKNYVTIGGGLLTIISMFLPFMDVMGIELKEGRSFSSQFSNDTLHEGQRGTAERESGKALTTL